MKTHALVMLLILSAISVSASSLDVAAVPLPDNARLQIVSTNAIHNGLVLSVATIESPEALAQSAQYYRDRWQAPENSELPGFVESQINNWLLISHLDNGINTVVQLDKSSPDRTVGYVSQSRIGESSSVTVDRDFPELLRISTTQSNDGPVSSTVTVYASRASVSATEQRTLRLLGGRGWSLITQNKRGQSRSLVFTQDSTRLEIVISVSSDYPALVVVNRVINQ